MGALSAVRISSRAICLGATAVGVGRPYLYSLVYGQDGVEYLTQSEYQSH